MKKNDLRNPINNYTNSFNPAGDVMAELKEAELNNIAGAGGAFASKNSSGNICSFTSECHWPSKFCC